MCSRKIIFSKGTYFFPFCWMYRDNSSEFFMNRIGTTFKDASEKVLARLGVVSSGAVLVVVCVLSAALRKSCFLRKS